MRRLFFDIETSPNEGFFWRTGHDLTLGPENILRERSIICIGYKFEGEPTAVLSWDKKQNPKSMLKEFSEIVAQADELVYHNGDKFDLPWVSTMLLKHNLPPLPEIPTTDTLKWARRKFAFNSNRLDYIAKFLGIGCKVKTEFALWSTVVRHPDPAERQVALDKMMHYCANDVELLEKLWSRLVVFAPVKTHAGVSKGLSHWSCPRDGSTNVVLNRAKISAKGTTQYQMRCKDCGGFYTISEKVYNEFLATKQSTQLEAVA